MTPLPHPTTILVRFRQALAALLGSLRGPRLILALSGGADSTALLRLCLDTAPDLDLTLVAAHLDHGLRGPEAARDLSAARHLAEEAGLRFFTDQVDCRALARARGWSIEEAGREARYAFLERARIETGGDFVVTGHTADDQTESILMNLLRGAGPQGLAGMAPRRGTIIRPLLDFTHAELIQYLTENGQTWVEDSSNQDPTFVRNRVRQTLLPMLRREFNPAVDRALFRMARVMRDEEDVWQRLLNEAKSRVAWTNLSDVVRLKRSGLRDMETALARRLVRAAVRDIVGQTRALGLESCQEAVDLASASGRGALDLQGGLRAWTTQMHFFIGRPSIQTRPLHDRELLLPGETPIPELEATITARLITPSSDLIGSSLKALDLTSLDSGTALLDLDSITPPLRVRNPRPGDRFQPLGLTGSKKLSDFFIDSHLSTRQRPLVAVLADDRGIVWLAGLRLAERVKVTSATRQVLSLTFQPGRPWEDSEKFS